MSEWIALSDKMPEKGVPVLITNGDSVSIAQMDSYSWQPVGWGGYDWDWYFTPIFWMSIPELPKLIVDDYVTK